MLKNTPKTFYCKAKLQKTFFVICKRNTVSKHFVTLSLADFHDFDDNSNFAFTVDRLKTIFLRKIAKMPLVTVSEIPAFR